MNLAEIQGQFLDHAARIMVRAGTKPTKNQLLGVNHYLASAEAVQRLIDQGPIEGEGFVQREYVPQHLRFSTKAEEELAIA